MHQNKESVGARKMYNTWSKSGTFSAYEQQTKLKTGKKYEITNSVLQQYWSGWYCIEKLGKMQASIAMFTFEIRVSNIIWPVISSNLKHRHILTHKRGHVCKVDRHEG